MNRTRVTRGLAVALLLTGGMSGLGGATPFGTIPSALAASTVSFAPQATYVVRNSPIRVAIGDFNGDGHPDLAVPNLSDRTVSVLLGKGDGTFGAQTTYPVGPSPQDVAIGDFNGDGHPDLAAPNFSDGTVSVLLGKGDGTFGAQTTYPVGSGPFGVATGDFNGDGHPDLAVINYSAGTVSVLLSTLSQTGVSNGTQASASVGGTGPNTPGSYTATASGASGSVTVATYPGNPTPANPPANANGYFDVKVSPGNSFTSVSIVDCNLGIGTGVYWFDGATWQVASPVSLNTPTRGCATLTVTGSSHPALSQLGGTPFVAGTASPTAARVSAAHATRQAGVLTLTWRVAHTRNIVGFDLYAGTLRLNGHLIPVHRFQSYAFHTRWSGAGPYTLHLILSNGTSISLPIH